jgi:hypothetical protein
MSVSGSQFVQSFSAVLVQRIVVGDPLAEQQSSNAIRVPNALSQQRGALARDELWREVGDGVTGVRRRIVVVFNASTSPMKE